MTGRYRLVESIGQGGMGRVWRAADEMLDRQVAVKEMRIDGLDAEDTRTRRERTLREARATARIDHPNVVRVYDVVDEGERLWIVMELVKGRSLERMIAEDGPLGPRDTALLGLGLVRALRQVHARGVLHRDIKPGNVLVESGDRTGHRIVLTDFGIAAMQDAKALTMVGMLVGSPDYMAPERVSGRPQGPPSDIWSLGATLCAALGGRSPFSRDTTLATLHAVLYEEPELPAAAGPLADVLTALLEKDPSIRPGLDEVEVALHRVAFPAPTPTLRMETGEDAGADGAGDAGEQRGTGEGGAATWTDPGREDSARASESVRADEAQQPEAAPAPERAGTSAPAWARGELRDPRDPIGPETSGTAGTAGTPGGSGVSADSGAPGGPSDARGHPPEGPDTPAQPPSPSVRWTNQEPPTRVVRAVRDPRVPEAEVPGLSEPTGSLDAVLPGRGSAGADGAGGSDSAAGGSWSVTEGAEPSDAVPPGHLPSEAGGAGASDSVPAESRSVAERVQPMDAVPPGHGPSEAGASDAPGSSPDGTRSAARTPEPSDVMAPGGAASDVAGAGDSAPAVAGAGDSARAVVGTTGSPPDVTGGVDSASAAAGMPDVAGAGDSARDVVGTTGWPPGAAGAEDSAPAVVGTTGSPPDAAAAGDSAPDVAGTAGSLPDLTGAEGSPPDAAGAGDATPDADAGPAGEVVAARAELGVPVEPFVTARSRLREPSADHRASASTEAVSEERSEVRSEAPSGNSAGASAGAALRAGATTTSTPLASAPTQDSLAAGVPTEHFPMPDAPTRDTPLRAASAPTRVGPAPPTRRSPHHPDPAGPAPTSGSAGNGGPGIDTDEPAADPRTEPRPGRDPDPALILGPHPHRMPPGELPGPARPATPHRGRRRTALVAAGSVVAAGAVVVAIILATTSGSPGDDKAGGSPSASASVSSSAPGASTPGGTPSSTVEGTARPRSLPPGAHEEAGGFAWATPTGWRRDVKTGAEVHYTSPDGEQELAAKSSLARGDLMETWRTSEQNAHQGQDYRKIRLEETTFRDHPAVVWEYSFTLGGVPWHARLLGFNVGDKSYQINTWYQPDIETQALRTYDEVKDSFTVL
ncbi:protein kinase [Streptomyces pseudovenezuelae]